MTTASFFEVAAIAMALHNYMDSCSHDAESYTLTIKRRPARIIGQPQTCPQRLNPGHKVKIAR